MYVQNRYPFGRVAKHHAALQAPEFTHFMLMR
jgi:hypothetical protein